MTDTIFSHFEQSCARNPDKILFTRKDQPDLSYGECLHRVQTFASALAELGVGKGDRVAVQIDKSTDAVLIYLACLQTGSIFLPLNTAYTPTEVAYFLHDAQPVLFIHQPETRYSATPDHLPLTLDAQGRGTFADFAEGLPARTAVTAVDARDVAALLYTSGTTGRPKGAMLTHGNLLSNCLALRDEWQFSEEDHLIHALPVFHAHGLFVACNLVFACGASMHFLKRFDADAVLNLCAASTVLMGVPTMYSRMLSSPLLSAQATEGMRLFISGSAPLPARTHEAFAQRTGHRILERYGMTETTMICSNPIDGVRKPGTVGKSLPGVEVRVVDEKGHVIIRPETPGKVEVRGPNVFEGYWGMPEKTAAEFRCDGFFVTGDLGAWDEDGHLKIVGRAKDLIISGGFNIYPKEVEAEIDALPGVSECAVIGLSAEDLGEEVAAIVVLNGKTAVTADDITSALADRLARFKIPRKIFFAESLPRNVMGKVVKARLREIHSPVTT